MLNKTNNKKSRLLIVTIGNILILVLSFLLFDCRFETNDDIALKEIACGAFGKPEYHMIHVNVIYGKILSFLYHSFGNISWYEISFYFLMFVSFFVIDYVLFNRIKNKRIIILSMIFGVMIRFNFYSFVQYTKIAGLLALAGLLSIYYYFENNSNSIFIVIGMFLITFGTWIRKNQCFLCLAIGSLLVLKLLKRLINEKNKKKLLQLFGTVISCFLSLLHHY